MMMMMMMLMMMMMMMIVMSGIARNKTKKRVKFFFVSLKESAFLSKYFISLPTK